MLTVEFDREFNKYVIHVGSIAIDGVSLTIAKLSDNSITVAIIPHTWINTIFKTKIVGDLVNLEFDFIGKYVEKQLSQTSQKSNVTIDWLREYGF